MIETFRLYHRVMNKSRENKNPDSPCCIESDIGSSESEATFSSRTQGEMSQSKFAASFSRYATTSATFGRNPMAEAFSGFAGRSPPTTEHPNATEWDFARKDLEIVNK